jgi:netrin-G3 ligand
MRTINLHSTPCFESISSCFQGYKVYYTVNPTLGMASWESQMVDNNQLTTISDLTPHTIYTIRVQAFTSVGPGPLSAPVLVKTQQGGMVYTSSFSV